MNHQAWNSGDGMTTSRWSMILRGAVAAIVFVASAPSVRAEVIGLDLTTNNPGSITLSGGDNTFTFDSFSIDYLIVAGGGGGAGARNSSPGGRGGGGGGAGGLLQGTGFAISGDQTITVGTGGTGGAGPTVGGFGGNSTAFGFTAIGGGGGGNNVVGTSATDGGSGGGAPSSTNVAANGGLGTPGQGNNGGPGNGSGIAGGGGGAGGAGVLLTGGAGVSSSITGSAVTYAAGGNGGTTASLDTVSVGAAAASTGNGGRGAAPGGANSTVTNAISGGTGGTGIVVVRYTGPQVLTGGTVSTVGGDTVHQFLSTGASTLDLYSATIDGDIDGSGSLVWDKTGILTLGGANTYMGSTQIDSGTIALSGSIGSTSDLSFVSGLLDLGSTGLIRVLQTNYSIADANTDIGNNRIQGSGLTVSTFNDGSNDYTQILAVPEPTVLALAACGGAISLAVLRRRRKTASA